VVLVNHDFGNTPKGKISEKLLFILTLYLSSIYIFEGSEKYNRWIK